MAMAQKGWMISTQPKLTTAVPISTPNSFAAGTMAVSHIEKRPFCQQKCQGDEVLQRLFLIDFFRNCVNIISILKRFS
jgi:hypothetical protein